MNDILEKLFGSAVRVKVMRLFLFNPGLVYDIEGIARRSKSSIDTTRLELNGLEKIGFIKRRTYTKEVKKRGDILRVKTVGRIFNEEFPYKEQLRNLLVYAQISTGDIARKLSRVGKLKLVIASGVFNETPESRVDLLVVGDNLKKNSLEEVVGIIESELGREIKYAAFETADFVYRRNMYDRLIRDILDFPHETILDRIGVDKAL